MRLGRDEDRLRQTLGDIEAALDTVSAEGEAIDPDRLIELLDGKTATLDCLLGQLMAAPPPPPPAPAATGSCDVLSILGELARLPLLAGNHQLIVRTELLSGPLLVDRPRAALVAELARTVRFAAEHAGKGGEISVRASADADSACVMIHARGADGCVDDLTLALTLRRAAVAAS